MTREYKIRKTSRLLVAALSDMSPKHPKGISLTDIEDYIENVYAVPSSDYKKYLERCLKSGIQFGAIKTYYSKFRLGAVFKFGSRKRKCIIKSNKKSLK